jgi:uncharacterized protein (DUF433 family)
MEPAITNYIDSHPEKCGGKPCIAGTRIRVYDIYVWHELHGQSADEIVSNFPQITLAQVHAALSYYHDHREEIHRQIKADEDFADSLRTKADSGPLEAAVDKGTSASW